MLANITAEDCQKTMQEFLKLADSKIGEWLKSGMTKADYELRVNNTLNDLRNQVRPKS